MADIALNFAFLIISLLLAISGAAIGAWFQHRSWVHQNWNELRQNRRDLALAVVQRASVLFDKRLYRQRRLIWAVRSQDEKLIESSLLDYRQVLFEWMDNLGQTKAELWSAFDRWTAIRFEEELHDPFARNGRIIERALRGRQGMILSTQEEELDRHGRTGYEFMQQLLERIQNEELSGIKGRHDLTLSNWQNLSSGFLLQRLFGLVQSR